LEIRNSNDEIDNELTTNRVNNKTLSWCFSITIVNEGCCFYTLV
jgi:hypothetical protein